MPFFPCHTDRHTGRRLLLGSPGSMAQFHCRTERRTNSRLLLGSPGRMPLFTCRNDRRLLIGSPGSIPQFTCRTDRRLRFRRMLTPLPSKLDIVSPFSSRQAIEMLDRRDLGRSELGLTLDARQKNHAHKIVRTVLRNRTLENSCASVPAKMLAEAHVHIVGLADVHFQIAAVEDHVNNAVIVIVRSLPRFIGVPRISRERLYISVSAPHVKNGGEFGK